MTPVLPTRDGAPADRPDRLAGWGRTPEHETHLLRPDSPESARQATAQARAAIARGSGLAYGDAAIGVGQTILMQGLDRLCAFDPATGLLTLEAGVTLSEIIRLFLPRGFFPPVVPNSGKGTVGGAIAADVFGINHPKAGGFGDHVESLLLALPDGQLRRCSRTSHADLFQATIGGMGLTGTILEATITLQPTMTGWIRQTTLLAPDLLTILQTLDQNDAAFKVGLIDCLAGPGRSLIALADPATPDELPPGTPLFPAHSDRSLRLPFDLPPLVVNRWTVGAVNRLLFRRGRARAGEPFLLPVTGFFFPLDGVEDRYRLYGRRGVRQFQCVLPAEQALPALERLVSLLGARRGALFPATVKKTGPSHGLLSLPLPGYSMTVDLPMTADLPDFVARLDAVVVAAGGRLSLVADGLQSRATLEAGYPELGVFRQVRRRIDPDRRLLSYLAERLDL